MPDHPPRRVPRRTNRPPVAATTRDLLTRFRTPPYTAKEQPPAVIIDRVNEHTGAGPASP